MFLPCPRHTCNSNSRQQNKPLARKAACFVSFITGSARSRLLVDGYLSLPPTVTMPRPTLLPTAPFTMANSSSSSLPPKSSGIMIGAAALLADVVDSIAARVSSVPLARFRLSGGADTEGPPAAAAAAAADVTAGLVRPRPVCVRADDLGGLGIVRAPITALFARPSAVLTAGVWNATPRASNPLPGWIGISVECSLIMRKSSVRPATACKTTS